LIEEVETTRRPRRIRRGDRDVAILMPATAHRGEDAARGGRFRRLFAIAEKNPEGDGDALLEQLEQEDDERRTQARA
jgi:hypothetical protein